MRLSYSASNKINKQMRPSTAQMQFLHFCVLRVEANSQQDVVQCVALHHESLEKGLLLQHVAVQ